MFFIIGAAPGRKNLNFHQMVICPECGGYGRYQVYMTYMSLTLFFIPVIKWKKEYFVQMSCCNALYRLNPEVGSAIAWGEELEIQPKDLKCIRGGVRKGSWKHCDNCGYTTEEDFDFCPKCGKPF